MKITLSWLAEHLTTSAALPDNISIQDWLKSNLETVTKALVDIGLEVEEVKTGNLDNFVVAKVKSVTQHPGADKLNVCEVDNGTDKILQIVCGAPNVKAGMTVVLAMPGAVVPNGGHVIKLGKIRGVESQGMLCSKDELNLPKTSTEDEEGIMALDDSFKAGSDLAKALGLDEVMIDISITPNRADCFSVYGIARDLVASNFLKINGSDSFLLKKLPQNEIIEHGECPVKVELSDPNCKYFSGRVITGIKNGPSPEWLRKKLESVGQKSISAIVDVTNYICLELGQPMHAFDLNKISGDTIYVKPSLDDEKTGGEKIMALNGLEYTLKECTTTVCDNRVISIAGIMGGESTACDMETNSIFLESAWFEPKNIALAGQSLNLHSDSRTRFERGVDPRGVDRALDRATQLIAEICGTENTKISPQVKSGELPNTTTTITLSQEKLTALSGDLGLRLSKAEEILSRLGFIINHQDEQTLSALAPSWRYDMAIAEDLVEEVLRLEGYDNIPVLSLPLKAPTLEAGPEDIIRKALCGRGLDEILSWSFTDQKSATVFVENKVFAGNKVSSGDDQLIEIAVPLSAEMAVMRPSLLTGLLKAAKDNQSKSQFNSAFFEIASCFLKRTEAAKSQVVQFKMASGIRCQKNGDSHWLASARPFDVFDAKSDLQTVLSSLGVSAYQLEASGPDYYHPHRKGTLRQGKSVLGYFGELHPKVLKDFDVQGPVVAFELFMENLPQMGKRTIKPLELSPYQATNRDFAFVVPKNLSADTLIRTISKVDKNIIQDIQVFDVYQGDKVDADKKSLAVRVKLQSIDKTLTENDLDLFMQQTISLVEKQCKGSLRQS